MPEDQPAATFYFDPACPWTWITSRWLVEVAEARDLAVRWRSLSLALVHDDGDDPEQLSGGQRLGFRSLRVVEHLAAQDRHDAAGAFYTAVGTALHVNRTKPSDELVAQAARSVGLEDVVAVADDDQLDPLVRSTHDEATDLVGDNVGSPVLVTPAGHAIFGPIVSPRPTGDAALALWDAVETLSAMPTFFELKRKREDGPVIN